MNASPGYYSVIQYCPDLGRFEAANIGVLLFCPERGFLQAKTARGNQRIMRFFGSEGHDWKRINAFKRGLEERLQLERPVIQSLDDLRHFIALRGNSLQLTPPLPLRVIDPEQDLANLFRELIQRDIAVPPTRNLQRFVSEQLARPELAGKIVRDIQVPVPVLDRAIEIPFGYQNGRFNLIKPVPFQSQRPEHVETTAAKYAVEGRSIYEQPDGPLGESQLIVVGKFRPQDVQTEARVRRILEANEVRLVPLETLPSLIDDIRRNGKELGAVG